MVKKNLYKGGNIVVYKNFKQLKLSALGMGSMRLPLIEGNNAKIDEQKATEMVAYAMENGINYYDTAWGYHNGNSEIVMGNVLSKYPRENYYLATKFPGYYISNMDKVEQIFEKHKDVYWSEEKAVNHPFRAYKMNTEIIIKRMIKETENELS